MQIYERLECVLLALIIALATIVMSMPVDSETSIIKRTDNSAVSSSTDVALLDSADETQLDRRGFFDLDEKLCVRILCTAEWRGMGCPPDAELSDLMKDYVSKDGLWFKTEFGGPIEITETILPENCPETGCTCRRAMKFVAWRMYRTVTDYGNFPTFYNGSEAWFADAECNGIESQREPVTCY